MDTLRTIDAEEDGSAEPADALESTPEPTMDPPPAIGTNERRMHVRAYNYWASLLGGRPFPTIADIDPASIGDFGPHSVLLDFTASRENPSIPWLGRALREEGGHEGVIGTLADVPGRSLMSRLTDHYLEVVANRAPIGFEAEFVNVRGHVAMYRGILMPFSSDGASIDFIYGVINWKEAAGAELVAGIAAEVARAMPAAAPAAQTISAWADGPSRHAAAAPVDPNSDALGDRLAMARESADLVRSANSRSRAALYRALGLAYDFALTADGDTLHPDYADLLDDAGIRRQARAPMTAIVKLVFGADYDKARLTEFAAALAYGRRTRVGPGGLRTMLEQAEGGLKAIVADERAARRPAAAPRPTDPFTALQGQVGIATLDMTIGDAPFVLLLARRDADTRMTVLGEVADAAMVERAMRRIQR